MSCTATNERNRPGNDSGKPTPAVAPAEHHDVSPPLREIPPAPRPPDDMKREVPIHRLPLPEQK